MLVFVCKPQSALSVLGDVYQLDKREGFFFRAITNLYLQPSRQICRSKTNIGKWFPHLESSPTYSLDTPQVFAHHIFTWPFFLWSRGTRQWEEKPAINFCPLCPDPNNWFCQWQDKSNDGVETDSRSCTRELWNAWQAFSCHSTMAGTFFPALWQTYGMRQDCALA